MGSAGADRERFLVLPGVTGLWQVSGRNRLTMRQGLTLDVEYVRRQSFVLDVVILLRTVPAVLATQGALLRRRRRCNRHVNAHFLAFAPDNGVELASQQQQQTRQIHPC